jgi:hypothetical protein
MAEKGNKCRLFILNSNDTLFDAVGVDGRIILKRLHKENGAV